MLKWLWFGLAVATVIGTAYALRYEPLPHRQSGYEGGLSVDLWDRWRRRPCFIDFRAGAIICSKEEAENFLRQRREAERQIPAR